MISTSEIDILHETPAPFLKDIRIVKASNRVTLPTKRDRTLKRINDMQNEVGRLSRLLDELRADVLELND